MLDTVLSIYHININYLFSPKSNPQLSIPSSPSQRDLKEGNYRGMGCLLCSSTIWQTES